jgi:putative phage-type endonuclease
MKIINCEQRTPEWHECRLGKITGTGLKKLVSTRSRSDFFYEILAERLTTEVEEVETALQRGVNYEAEALKEFEKFSGKIVNQAGFCQSSKNEWIGYSPDGIIKIGKKYSEDIEIKCPASKTHLKIWLENKIPEEYDAQIIQAFIVNPDLKKRYFISYDSRISIHPIHVIEVSRSEVEEKIAEYEKLEREFIDEINAKLEELLKL